VSQPSGPSGFSSVTPSGYGAVQYDPSQYGARPDPSGRPSSSGLTVVVCGFCAALIAVWPARYAVLSPGPATNALGKTNGQPLIQVTGHPTFPTSGSLDFTTVRIYGGPGTHVNLFIALKGWLSRNDAVIPEELEFPKDKTSQQIDEQNAQDMTTSQEDAAAAALRELGITVPETVTVASRDASAPAAKVLRDGDVITTIDGVKLTSNEQLHAAIEKHKPGDVLRLGLIRNKKPLTVNAKLTKDGDRTLLGITPGITFKMPFSVKIDTHDVGGPSAGTMFALAVYDTLTPGSLTGGKRIAGTGTIDPSNGAVGPIGGIAQKMVGAKDAGAQWFLAPDSNCDEVVGHVPDGLRVVKIGTLHEARLDVEKIAAGNGGSLPTCT
jgi:Lon-like protease